MVKCHPVGWLEQYGVTLLVGLLAGLRERCGEVDILQAGLLDHGGGIEILIQGRLSGFR